MPFTLSHPAAVLPLARTKLLFSALVAGALAPDIGYFLTFSSQHAESHSLPGVFLVCLPAAFLLLLLFHKLLKKPLLELFPSSHQARLAPYAGDFRFLPASRFALVVVSLLVGSVTHLVWDSFTHKTGWVVQHVPALAATLFSIPGQAIPVYKVLQHLSTIFGLLIVIGAYWSWYQKAAPRESRLPRLAGSAKAAIACLMLLGASAAALVRTVPPLLSLRTIRPNVVQGTIAFVSAFVVEAIVFSLIWYLARGREQRLAR